MHKNLPLDMKLQLFAEDGAGGDDNGGGAGTENKPELMSFDDYLSAGGQSEFDRRVQKAVQTAVSKAQEKWTALQDEKLSEAEKLAKMTQAEKAQYMAQKREKELHRRGCLQCEHRGGREGVHRCRTGGREREAQGRRAQEGTGRRQAVYRRGAQGNEPGGDQCQLGGRIRFRGSTQITRRLQNGCN